MQNKPDLDAQVDELAALLDALVESGSEHINLEVGEQTRIRTVNSTDCCGKPGACAVPNFEDKEDPERSDEDEEDW